MYHYIKNQRRGGKDEKLSELKRTKFKVLNLLCSGKDNDNVASPNK